MASVKVGERSKERRDNGRPCVGPDAGTEVRVGLPERGSGAARTLTLLVVMVEVVVGMSAVRGRMDSEGDDPPATVTAAPDGSMVRYAAVCGEAEVEAEGRSRLVPVTAGRAAAADGTADDTAEERLCRADGSNAVDDGLCPSFVLLGDPRRPADRGLVLGERVRKPTGV
jgi:hypothetical protein